MAPNETAKKGKYWERDALTPFVSARAGELVRAPWMGGAVTTLGEAMMSCGMSISEEGQDGFIAMLDTLLTSYAQEEPESEVEAEKDEMDEAEESEKVLGDKAANKPQNNKTAPKTQKDQFDQKSLPNNTAQKISDDKPAVSKFEKPDESKSQGRTTPGEKAEASIDNLVADTVKIENDRIPKIYKAATKPVEADAEPPVGMPADKLQPKVAEGQAMLDEPEKTAGDITTSEIKPEIYQTKPEESEKNEITTTNESAEITINLAAESSQEEEFESPPDTIVDAVLIYSREDFEANVFAQFESGETAEIVSELLEVGATTTFLETIEENQKPEQNDLANLTIEEIEQPLVQLAEAIETSSPEVIEEINQILDKIIEVPAKLSAQSVENIVTEAEAQEELEELFINLLDRMGIDYTPELVESLACLTIRWSLADEIEKMIKDEEPDALPQASGTHEIIKKLLTALSKIKKAITHSVAIGKSALKLYSLELKLGF